MNREPETLLQSFFVALTFMAFVLIVAFIPIAL